MPKACRLTHGFARTTGIEVCKQAIDVYDVCGYIRVPSMESMSWSPIGYIYILYTVTYRYDMVGKIQIPDCMSVSIRSIVELVFSDILHGE